MKFNEATVADILRCAQRDDAAANELQDYLHSILKLYGAKNYHKYKKNIPATASVWYYFMTTLGNLQTLGEEYTGTIRFTENNTVPTKIKQTFWLTLHIGGEAIIDRLILYLKNKITASSSLTADAKIALLQSLEFVSEHKETFRRIHHSIFYIHGKYYNISNRASGIKYVLLRDWMHDDSFSGGFKVLGKLTLFYVLFHFVQQVWSYSTKTKTNCESAVATTQQQTENISQKTCILCGENRKNSSITPCGHVFCWDCIYDSLSYQQSCPLCREIVTPSRVILLQNYI